MAKGRHRATRIPARSRSLSLLLGGVLIGMMLITPVGAHFTQNSRHLGNHAWNQVIKGKVYTRAQANSRFYTKAQIDQRAIGCRGNGSGDAMVKVGSICIDRYENSIWTARTGGTRITGAIPCLANGQDCKGKIFARSVPGVPPRASITWFQAQAALANSGKRLPTNAEWQMAVQGTPDSTACNVSTGSVANTGANAGCVSDWGANDMVGNVWEWVADWVPRSTTCGSWPSGYGNDLQCLVGAATTGAPGALMRGESASAGAGAGPFAVNALVQPSGSVAGIGFRGAR